MYEIKPRMQRVDAGYLHSCMHTHLTDKEWKEISDLLCTREHDRQVMKKLKEYEAMKRKGPPL